MYSQYNEGKFQIKKSTMKSSIIKKITLEVTMKSTIMKFLTKAQASVQLSSHAQQNIKAQIEEILMQSREF